jgi:hypothetical protein
MNRQYAARRILEPKPMTLSEQWVAIYGETMTAATAARMFGVSRWTIYRHRDAGDFEVSGSRILTRSLAEFVEHGQQQQNMPKPTLSVVRPRTAQRPSGKAQARRQVRRY